MLLRDLCSYQILSTPNFLTAIYIIYAHLWLVNVLCSKKLMLESAWTSLPKSILVPIIHPLGGTPIDKAAEL